MNLVAATRKHGEMKAGVVSFWDGDGGCHDEGKPRMLRISGLLHSDIKRFFTFPHSRIGQLNAIQENC
jgi:hypothetical protein